MGVVGGHASLLWVVLSFRLTVADAARTERGIINVTQRSRMPTDWPRWLLTNGRVAAQSYGLVAALFSDILKG